MDKLISYIKRPQVWGFFVSVAVMAVIALAFFYPDNFEGNSLQQPDMVQGAANGHEGQLWEEATGEKALWTNSLFGGMPTFQISPSYPSNSLFTWFNNVYGLWLPSPSNLLFMMMMGFFLLMYALGKRWYYALIGAIAWGFSSYFVIIIGAGHIWKFLALTYIPPTIAGLLLLYRRHYVIGTAMTAFFAMMQLAANHPQMSYYFGIVMAIVAVCYLIDAIRKHAVRGWCIGSALALVAGALALGANAPSLYNTYEYSKETKRAVSELAKADAGEQSGESAERPTGGMAKNDIVGWSYGRSEMFSLLVPNIKGGSSARPEGGHMVATSLSELDDAKSISQDSAEGIILNYLPQYFNDSEGTNGPVYVGAIIVALFLLGCFIVKGPLKWAMIATVIVGGLLSLGYNFMSLTDWMIYNFPLYNKFRAVESVLVVVEFAMPLLGVLALVQFIESGKEAWKKYRTPLCVSFGIPAFFALIAVVFPTAYGDLTGSQDISRIENIQNQYSQYLAQQGVGRQQVDEFLYSISLANPTVRTAVETLRGGLVRNDALRSLLFLALSFAALSLFGMGKSGKVVTVGTVGLLVLIDLYGVDKRYVNHSSFGAPAGNTQGITADAIDNAILTDTNGHYRVLDIPGFSDARRSYFHSMIGGYHAAKLNRYEDLINERLVKVLMTSYRSEYDDIEEVADAKAVVNMLNTRYVITGDAQRPLLLNSSAKGNAWLVDSLVWVDGARAEMDALTVENITTGAVAERAFADVLPAQPNLTPGDTIAMTYYSPNTLKYHANTANGGVAVFSEVWFPWGWKATIDGEPAKLARVNYILRAIAVPAGSHEISMTFSPDSISRSTNVAYACVGLIYLLLLCGVFVEVKRCKQS